MRLSRTAFGARRRQRRGRFLPIRGVILLCTAGNASGSGRRKSLVDHVPTRLPAGVETGG
jgi:hypothetical protein